ncbi:hypothetical protein BDY19DRAFT_870565, partial [Irpex rosettiformis]
LTIRWVPGHEGIDGNEEADLEAKQAAHNYPSERVCLPPLLRKALPQSTSKMKQVRKAEMKELWSAKWTSSKRFHKMSKID